MIKSEIKTDQGITTITAETTINAPKSEVWAVSSHIGAIANFHPLVKSSKTLTPYGGGLGARRYCELLPLGAMEEEVVEWQEGQSFIMEVVGGKLLPPYKFMRGLIQLEEDDGQSRVRFSFSYQLKFGLLGRLLNHLMIKGEFKKAPPQYVEGLKKYMELGQ